MRDILFRGKCVCTGEWIYGFYKKGRYCSYISTLVEILLEEDPHANRYTQHWISNEVDSDTVGQYTGLKDKNGQRIFEGDKVKASKKTFDVMFKHGSCGYFVDDIYGFIEFSAHQFLDKFQSKSEIVGTIHDKDGE